MATKQVAAFLTKVHEDKALAQKLTDAQAAYKSTKEDGIAKVVVPIAAEAGFNFTADEFKAAMTGNEKLSEKELEAVAGGDATNDICGMLAEAGKKIVCNKFVL